MAKDKTASRSSKTRAALVEAGIKLFGERGFEATSTRDLAAAANANVASIAYHFGGKEGLRLACARAIVARYHQIAGAAILASDPGEDSEAAMAVIETALGAMIRFLVTRPEAQDIAAFVVREMTHPSPAVDLIYDEMAAPIHMAFCRLWGMATDSDPEGEATKLAVFAIIGQVIYFRLAQPIVLKRLDWDQVGPDEADRIAATIIGNLKKLAATSKGDRDD